MIYVKNESNLKYAAIFLPSLTPVLSRHSLAAGRNQSSNPCGGHLFDLQRKKKLALKSENIYIMIKQTFSSRRTSTATAMVANKNNTVNLVIVLFISTESRGLNREKLTNSRLN